jgi:hypothetical protein
MLIHKYAFMGSIWLPITLSRMANIAEGFVRLLVVDSMKFTLPLAATAKSRPEKADIKEQNSSLQK